MAAPLVHGRGSFHSLARIFLLLPAVLVCLTVLGGCGYRVHLRGMQIEEQPAVPEGASIYVAPSPEAAAADDQESIQRKIELLLGENGYVVAGKEEAGHYLFFSHDMESLMSRMSLELTTGVRGGMATQRREGPYDRRLSMRVVEADKFRNGEEETIWASSAVIRGAPTQSPKFDDLLLLATFRHFPDDTGQTVVEKVNLESKQARRLR